MTMISDTTQQHTTTNPIIPSAISDFERLKVIFQDTKMEKLVQPLEEGDGMISIVIPELVKTKSGYKKHGITYQFDESGKLTNIAIFKNKYKEDFGNRVVDCAV